MRIGYLGPEASFSFQAVEKIFPQEEKINCNSISTVFDFVDEEKIDKGVVPIENSTGGSVPITLDELISKNVFIEGEFFLKIEHSLLSNYKLEDIKQIFSHPQAFAQCKKWLQKNAFNKELIEVVSTSTAAEKASKIDFSAAIASSIAGEKFGLNILKKQINDLNANETKFIIITKQQNNPLGKQKTSMIFGAKNEPGSLFKILKSFKDENINLTKLESRPSPEKDWEYLFFVDLEGNLSQQNILNAIKNIKENSVETKILGSYSKVFSQK